MWVEWMLQAKCRNTNPRLFDSDDPNPAILLCAGCTVKPQCADWHLQPINVTEYVERIAGHTPDVEDDVVYPSGVKAAGLNLGG